MGSYIDYNYEIFETPIDDIRRSKFVLIIDTLMIRRYTERHFIEYIIFKTDLSADLLDMFAGKYLRSCDLFR